LRGRDLNPRPLGY